MIRSALVLLFCMLMTPSTFAQKDEDAVLKFLNDALQKDPDNYELLFNRAALAFANREYREAIFDLNSALSKLNLGRFKEPLMDKPTDSLSVIILRAYCYDMTNKIDSAINDYRYVQALKPDDFVYAIVVARLLIKHKDFQRAQMEIDRLKNLTYNERGLTYQAILFYEMKRYQDALKVSDLTLAKYPSSAETLLTKAKVLDKLHSQREACEVLVAAEAKCIPEYFGGNTRYQQDFKEEIEKLKIEYCKLKVRPDE